MILYKLFSTQVSTPIKPLGLNSPTPPKLPKLNKKPLIGGKLPKPKGPIDNLNNGD